MDTNLRDRKFDQKYLNTQNLCWEGTVNGY